VNVEKRGITSEAGMSIAGITIKEKMKKIRTSKLRCTSYKRTNTERKKP